MNRLLSILLCCLALCAASCPNPGQGGKGPAAKPPAPKPVLSACLVRTDLGLGDGYLVRESDAVLTELAKAGRITYLTVGELPKERVLEGGVGDIGLPDQFSNEPGSMTLNQARALLGKAPASDLLLLSTPLLLDSALEAVAAHKLSAKAVLLLDEEGLRQRPAKPPVPVYYVRYDIRPAAFVAGVAAAASSNNGMFIVMGSSDDPQAEQFLSAVEAGLKSYTNGAQVFTTIVKADADGLISPESFSRSRDAVLKAAGPYFASNHYILCLGRATPTALYAMTQKPVDGYVVGAYADYRIVRRARVLGCALKHPGAALRYILGQPALAQGVPGLASVATDGLIKVGLDEDAVGFTAFDLYSRYNPDGEDIAKAVEENLAEIKAGEQQDYKF